jgi:hypothetical protein
MLAASWCASRLRCRSSLPRFEPHLIHDPPTLAIRTLWHSVSGTLDLFPGTLAVAGLWKIARTRSAWARCAWFKPASDGSRSAR